MYIPKKYLTTDREEIVAFMQQYSFAAIITSRNNHPIATHLPFVVSVKGNTLSLTSHFAKANEQWRDVVENEVLVIFSEPHAYISPRHYDQELSVPTWNYVAVHAYGNGEIITDTDKTVEILENSIQTYEASYMQQWDSLSEEYKSKMVKAIVAFEIVVTDLQAKKKLSQNRTEAEQRRIVESLSAGNNKNEQDIAAYMKQNLMAAGEITSNSLHKEL